MPASRVVRLALVATALGVLVCLWNAWCEFPFYAWNDVRLAPAFALRHGVNPYPLIGDGPLFTWIYGPVSLFLHLPATLAGSAAGALHTAMAINTLLVLLPPAVILFAAPELRARGLAPATLAWCVVALVLPRSHLVLHVADHAAIAFGLLSCWLLARVPAPGAGRLAVAAACGALAVWSKQIALFVLPAQLVYLGLATGRTTVLRYTAWLAAWGFAALGTFVMCFGFANLWLNLVAIPGRLPWAEFWPRFTMRPWTVGLQVIGPIALLVAVWRSGHWPGRDSESGRLLQLTTLVAAAMLPVGLAGYFKIGGDLNLLHSLDYLLPALLLAWLAREPLTAPGGGRRVLAVAVVALGLRAPELLAPARGPFTGHLESAGRLAAAHPHALWFPQHPVLTYYADGRLWHSEDGVLTRSIAGYGIREPEFRRHLPQPLTGAVYPEAVQFPFAMPLLNELNQSTRHSYWTLHHRRSAAVDGAAPR